MTPPLGRYGVWRSKTGLTPELAAVLEQLGFGAVWIGGSLEADLELAEALIAATEHLTVATGITNIWTADPHELADSYARVEEAHPGRLIVGIGTGHPEAAGEKAATPYGAMVDYLDVLDEEGVPRERRMLAALGPRMLRLARERSAGIHPYLVTPAFSAAAREAEGPDRIIATEQRVVLRADPEEARALGRPTVDKPYLGFVNYLNNLRRLGYGDADLTSPGSDRLIDDLVVYGDAATVKSRLDAHLDAGADHVAVQLITAPGEDAAEQFGRLARALGIG